MESVSGCIDEQPMPQREIRTRLGEMIPGDYPRIEESMKLGMPCFGDEDMKGLKETGKTTRNLMIRSVDLIDGARTIALLAKVQGRKRT